MAIIIQIGVCVLEDVMGTSERTITIMFSVGLTLHLICSVTGVYTSYTRVCRYGICGVVVMVVTCLYSLFLCLVSVLIFYMTYLTLDHLHCTTPCPENCTLYCQDSILCSTGVSVHPLYMVR